MAASLPYWRQEFAIGYRAFASPAIYRDGFWLAVQIDKEHGGSGVYGPADTHEIARDQLAEEHVHAELLRALKPLIEGPIPAEPSVASGAALVALRNASWPDPALRIAVAMSEGGGLGMFQGALAAISCRAVPLPQDAAFTGVLHRIVADERGHVAAGFAAYANATLDPTGEAAVLTRLTEILALKVEERQDQFAAALATAEPAPPGLTRSETDYAAWAGTAFVTAP